MHNKLANYGQAVSLYENSVMQLFLKHARKMLFYMLKLFDAYAPTQIKVVD